MITKENYFQKLKFLKPALFPKPLKKAFLFAQEATDNGTTWEYYDADKTIRAKMEKYFTLLNEHLKLTAVEKISTSTARELAKNLIRSAVTHGSTLKSLLSTNTVVGGGNLSATVRNGKIEISKINKQTVSFTFTVKEIFEELQNEKNDKGKNPKNNDTPLQGKDQERKQNKSKNEPGDNDAIHYNYDNSRPVERISEELKFIKRFLSFHNAYKTKIQVASFIKALKKAIFEKTIRLTSKYAAEIMQIQKQLVASVNVMSLKQKFTLSPAIIENMTAIVESARVRISTQYLKRFAGIEGQIIDKQKAQNLYDLILGGLETNKITEQDPNFDRIKKVARSLKEFIQVAGKNETLRVHQETLNGLDSSLGCSCQDNVTKEEKDELAGFDEHFVFVDVPEEKKEPEVMTIDEARSKEYTPVEITGKWLELIGKFCVPTQFFVYGPGGGGKTSFVLLFTQYLCSLGYKILYVAGEQFDTPTFTELLNRLNIQAGDNFQIVKNPDTLSPDDFDFVVLDSKDHLMVDIDNFKELRLQYPNQSFIVLSQGTKAGNFRGKETWRNEVDVMLRAEKGIVTTGIDKNRWGGAGQMVLFDQPQPVAEVV